MKKNISNINYKNIKIISLFLNRNGNILPKRITGFKDKEQKHIARCIKKAKNLNLIPNKFKIILN